MILYENKPNSSWPMVKNFVRELGGNHERILWYPR